MTNRQGVSRGVQRAGGALVLCLVLAGLPGCSFVKMTVARVQPRDRFVPTDINADVRYAEGSRAVAERVARALDGSRKIVEKTHGQAFLDMPPVYVCHTDCIDTFVPGGKDVTAAHFGNAVFMNDERMREREKDYNASVENFLTHELAHVLLYQHAGALAYMRVPSWFREGLAVSVSNGAGAEACTAKEAAQHIVAGSAFDPAEEGSVFRDKTAWAYALKPAVFYREAGLFVDYLRTQNPLAFDIALKQLLTGKDFQHSFAQAYGQTIASHWPGFVASMEQLLALH